jgi:hypothetical protein
MRVVRFEAYNILSCKRAARQRLDKHPAMHARNIATTGLCNAFPDNGSVNKLPRRRNYVTFQQYLAIT